MYFLVDAQVSDIFKVIHFTEVQSFISNLQKKKKEKQKYEKCYCINNNCCPKYNYQVKGTSVTIVYSMVWHISTFKLLNCRHLHKFDVVNDTAQ